MHLTIRTPDGTLLTAENTTRLALTLENGSYEVLPLHATMVASISYSPIRVATTEGEHDFVGRRGVLLVDNKENSATLLLSSCTPTKELSLSSAKEYLAFIEEQLSKGESLSDFHMEFLQEEQYAIVQQVKEGKG